MSTAKLIAGHAVRRVRRQNGLSQAAMAEMLDISPSYLNLIERNQRPVSAALLVRLVETFDFDPRALTAAAPGGGSAAMRRRLADPMFADLEIDRSELEEWLAAAPGGAEAFARAFDRLAGAGGGHGDAAATPDPTLLVRREIERWRNHFPDLDSAAELLADELRLASGDLHAALTERLRVRHALSIRVLPVDIMPDRLVRLDLHARQLQLSEMLEPSGRVFALAVQLAQSEMRGEIDALARGAAFGDRIAERLFRRYLAQYFAAALVMPYARFLRACEATGYDLAILRRRFGVSHEQLAHRLTTLNRVGARGLPFFLMRIDRAGQVSKRLVGAADAGLVDGEALCPLWNALAAFDRAGEPLVERVVLPEGTSFVTIAQRVERAGRSPTGMAARFVVLLGLAAELSGQWGPVPGLEPVPIGPGCRRCPRADCPQRSLPAIGRALLVNERERTVASLPCAGD
ncbi:short-chain fatty acyl-CoA regulator family protein [uncultured Sphingomonas sp.]|uniref:helix-turn-helix domain-containing protein n=1 Tax=uncultured Sphingomonas sp. TaxID=158754 RepID=UPI0025E750A3|nr:short-chain fatty acyl-CoA regulator family protein [uncultured Sphingomonas sp.]